MYKSFLDDIKIYSTNQKTCKYKMDANENHASVIPMDRVIEKLSNADLNRYPDGASLRLREKIAKSEDLNIDNVILGSGSSEVIEMLFKVLIGAKDTVVGFSPSFSMYQLYTEVQGGKYISVDLGNKMEMEMDKLDEKCKEVDPKLIIICNPNNPTGSWIGRKEIITFLEGNKDKMVLLDEAYVEFMGESSSDLVKRFSNLFVAKTFSKAYGLAGVRLGYILSNQVNITQLNKIRPPYNINIITQICGEIILDSKSKVEKNIEMIKEERDNLYQNMKNSGIRVYPSMSNFIYFYGEVKQLQDKLLEKGVLIRKYSGQWDNYYRVTVGSREENQTFIRSLQEVMGIENS